MQLNIQTMQSVEVDVESIADAALASIPAIPSIFQPVAKTLLNGGLTLAFNWLNEHFGAAPTAGVSVNASTNPPSVATTAAVSTTVHGS